MDQVSTQFACSFPVVGDRVDVYKTKDKVIEMEVCGRRLTTEHDWDTDGENCVLEIELCLTHMWQERGIYQFEKWVTGRE